MAKVPTATKRSSALALWDLTIPYDKVDILSDDKPEETTEETRLSASGSDPLEVLLLVTIVKDFFKQHCSRWVFQLEKGEETGYLHFQCRVSFNTKRRIETMTNWLPKLKPGWHFSPTSNPTYYKGNMFYVMKDETRIDGPWDNIEDERLQKIPLKYRDPCPKWRPFQKTIKDLIEQPPDDRSVNYCYQADGFIGKSFFVTWHCCRELAHQVPEMDSSKDIARMVMCMPPSRCYFFDLPKSVTKGNMMAMYKAIEKIKDGYCYDERNKFKCRYFDSPHVWVFSNSPPDLSAMSKDRWKLWQIDNNEELIQFIPSTADITSEVKFLEPKKAKTVKYLKPQNFD